ncbi:Putative Phosphatidylserine decarboxylase [Bradyrhizobium sp. ORS 285]|uniref:phosphatidylserine decarboxylase n=1 Tax=Bradyrhizobium sp. ORS 285 TaxID=115808 RepID=UPI0002406734|nr:phosphatidylserine decarboxylase [Bradyrhizobium sp. ORS 285]CCD84868.1 putative Phosphatidylserine decarboxylase [Bradyrhizobium sp. ORS 285]SMX55673.1 Putative Phosphatidylserine decarboxylase [Bradyrhizobium sp. ORS 285]
MSKPLPLPVRDRASGRVFQEFMDDSPATYESEPRRSWMQWLQSQPAVDWLIAAYQDTRFSARKIEPFIRKHGIDMSQFEPGPFRTYAEFFERRFRAGMRSFPEQVERMGAFAEARYFAWERLRSDMEFPIKGTSLRPQDLLGNAEFAARFEGGPVIGARLAPMDYHHLHYVDDGETIHQHRIGGRLWTVNRNALQHQPGLLFQNERVVQLLRTANFGVVGFVEIGALTVGRIVQQHPFARPFSRGQEKSTFRFGGSAVVLFGEPGRWLPERDLLDNTARGIETFIRLGEPIAHRA